MLVDSHCHLDKVVEADANFTVAGLLEAAKANDVQHMLCVCLDLEHFPTVYALAEQHETVSASVGVHPNEEVAAEPTAEQLIVLAKQPQVVAIGETGLDYYRTEGDCTEQQQRFRAHIQAALAVNKPLIIHTRQAREDRAIISDA